MARGVLLFLLNKACFILALFVLSSCARPAPDLPPDTSKLSRDNSENITAFVPVKIQKMKCLQIFKELKKLAKHDSVLENAIHANRAHNQNAGYIGGLIFFPALFTIKNNDLEKEALDKNQQYRDQLIVAYRLNSCPGKKISK